MLKGIIPNILKIEPFIKLVHTKFRKNIPSYKYIISKKMIPFHYATNVINLVKYFNYFSNFDSGHVSLDSHFNVIHIS